MPLPFWYTLEVKGAMKRWIAFASVIILLAFSIFSTFKRVEVLKSAVRMEGKELFIPSSRFLKPASLGFDTMVADLYWLRTVQYIGDDFWFKKRYPQLFQLIDLVTDMDPKFEYAYEVGGIILSVYSRRIDESIKILKKGYRQNLGYWEIPFFLGFNYFYYLGDYEKAARYLTEASRLPRSPAYLPKLAAKLYAKAGDPDTAIEFLTQVYRSTDDERMKKEIEERIKEVMVERDIQYLERAVEVYRKRFGEYPQRLDLLVARGVIDSLPKEPFGGYYYIDPVTKEIKSSVKKERLRIYRKKGIRKR